MVEKRPGRTSTVQALAMLGLLAGALPADAATADDDRWHFQVMPYLWLPVVDSSVDVTLSGLRGRQGQDLGTVTLSAETDPNDYLSDLRAALMLRDCPRIT